MIEAVKHLEHHIMKWIDHKQARLRALRKLNVIKEVLSKFMLDHATLRQELNDAKARPQRNRKASGRRTAD